MRPAPVLQAATVSLSCRRRRTPRRERRLRRPRRERRLWPRPDRSRRLRLIPALADAGSREGVPARHEAGPPVDAHGRRLIATALPVPGGASRLPTPVRLSEAARYIVAASPDGCPPASSPTPRDIGVRRAGPHARLAKRRSATLSPSPAFSPRCPGARPAAFHLFIDVIGMERRSGRVRMPHPATGRTGRSRRSRRRARLPRRSYADARASARSIGCAGPACRQASRERLGRGSSPSGRTGRRVRMSPAASSCRRSIPASGRARAGRRTRDRSRSRSGLPPPRRAP